MVKGVFDEYYEITVAMYENIVRDFKCIDAWFVRGYDKWKAKWNRKYFPNLRYVALTLMEMHGYEYAYFVPKARTGRKRKVLGDICKDFIRIE